MLRSSFVAASAALLLCATAPAQQQVQAHKLLSPIRDAGIYHVSTGTWTRSGNQTNIHADVIYNATSPSGYFGTGWEGQWGTDEGILPGSGNIQFPGATVAGAYTIDGFAFYYCALGTGGMTWEHTFYSSYDPCDLPTAPTSCIEPSGGPGPISGLPNAGACWVVTVDLTGGGEVCLETDGGPCFPGYDGNSTDFDHFGWGSVWNNAGSLAGPILMGGDAEWAVEGEGTCYDTALTCFAGANGAGQRDFFAIDGPGALGPGCYWFGGYFSTNGCGGPQNNPAAQFGFELFTDCSIDKGDCGDCGTVVCDNTGVQHGSVSIDSCDLADSPNLAVGDGGGQATMVLVSAGNTGSIFPPGSQGTELCLTSPVGRYNKDVAAPPYTLNLETNNTGGGGFGLPSPPGGSITSGSTWSFQSWTRIGAGDARFSKGLEVTFN